MYGLVYDDVLSKIKDYLHLNYRVYLSYSMVDNMWSKTSYEVCPGSVQLYISSHVRITDFCAIVYHPIYNWIMDHRTNDEWMNDLSSEGDRKSLAMEDLRSVILRGLPYALSGEVEPDSPEFNAISNAIIQKTLLHVQEYMNTFDGKSSFTTWVLKFAVHQAFLELRLQRWQANANQHTLPEIPPAFHEQLAQNESLQRFYQIFKDELTQNQRTAIGLMMMYRMPKEEVARYLGMDLCDYFKMIHEARLRLKRRLEAEGWLSRGKTVQV
jgi:RNA polymerase sigma factor (sigma-70 family)